MKMSLNIYYCLSSIVSHFLAPWSLETGFKSQSQSGLESRVAGSLSRLLVIIVTGFIPLSLLSNIWLCEKAASGLEKILFGVLVKEMPGKHG